MRRRTRGRIKAQQNLKKTILKNDEKHNNENKNDEKNNNKKKLEK